MRARYCADTLLVYVEPAHLKVLGNDHRAVHAAPHSYVGGGLRGQLAPLHWLEGGVAQGSLGRASVALPDCLSDAARGGALPSGRAALGGLVKDPFVHTRARVTRERQVEACGAAITATARRWCARLARNMTGRGNKVGTPIDGAWKVLVDQCRADYTALAALHGGLQLGCRAAAQQDDARPGDLAAAQDGDGGGCLAGSAGVRPRRAAGPGRRRRRRWRR